MTAPTAESPAHAPRSGRKVGAAVKIAVPIVVTGASLAALKFVVGGDLIRPAQLEAAVKYVGVWGPVLFVLALAVRPLLLLPAQLFCAVAGMLWGGIAGTAVSVAGSWLSLLLVVAVGRRLLKRPLARWMGARRGELERVAQRHDLLYGLVVMLNPLLPADLCIAVAAGAGARLSRLGLGAALGIVPGAFSTAFFGSALNGSRPVLLGLSIAAMAVSILGGALIATSIWRSLKGGTPAVATQSIVDRR